jgi:hypothetical protein
VWCAKLLTITAITFTWANADFDRRAAHSTSEMGHQRRFGGENVMSVVHPILAIRHRNRHGRKCQKATFAGADAKCQNYFGAVASDALGSQKLFDPNRQLPDPSSGGVMYRVSDRGRGPDIGQFA